MINMSGFYLFIAIASLISVLITFFLGIIFKSTPIVKYIPAMISVLAGLGFYIKSRFFSSGTGFEDLGYIVFTLIAGILFFISLITAIVMDLINRNKGQNN
jgi:hypothetical protein